MEGRRARAYSEWEFPYLSYKPHGKSHPERVASEGLDNGHFFSLYVTDKKLTIRDKILPYGRRVYHSDGWFFDDD